MRRNYKALRQRVQPGKERRGELLTFENAASVKSGSDQSFLIEFTYAMRLDFLLS